MTVDVPDDFPDDFPAEFPVFAAAELDENATPIQVVGIGLDGADGLMPPVRAIVDRATLLVGSTRHLDYFIDHPADYVVLGDLGQAIEEMNEHLGYDLRRPTPEARDRAAIARRCIVVLASGDPLFFGLGRLLLAQLPAEAITFHPHISSLQLAFSRVKLPWQNATTISAHGRAIDLLVQALRQGDTPIGILTDARNSPLAIAQLILSLELHNRYCLWVCENLGGAEERVRSWVLDDPDQMGDLDQQTFAALNVVIVERLGETGEFDPATQPLIGIPDRSFLTFGDRPGLMTKRETRLLALGELALFPGQVVWDVGAGTGSVAIEMARLCPDSQIYAIEKTAAGIALIERNASRFHTGNVVSVRGTAPEVLRQLPPPDRVFIGGSGGHLGTIVEHCTARIAEQGRIVIALATLDRLGSILAWAKERPGWEHRILQSNLARSVSVGSLDRLAPLNPVMLVTLIPSAQRDWDPGDRVVLF